MHAVVLERVEINDWFDLDFCGHGVCTASVEPRFESNTACAAAASCREALRAGASTDTS